MSTPEACGLVLHAESHLDHGLTMGMVQFLLARYKARQGFFIETLQLPPEMAGLTCGLYGPALGDHPVTDEQVTLAARNGRAWVSRLIEAPARPTQLLTVIAGPHAGFPCVLYTSYGGPQAPQEPGDPGNRDLEAAKAFWAVHALAR